MPKLAKYLPLLMLFWGAATATGQELLVPHEHHEWARFPAGSSKQVRQVTETFKEGELISTSTTTLKLRLTEVGEDFIVLERESTSEVRGQTFDKPKREFRSSLNNEPSNSTATVTIDGKDSLTIQGKAFPCEVRRVEIQGPTSRIVGKVFYHPGVAPFVLRREYLTSNEGSDKPEREVVSEVIALAKPYPVLTELKTVAFILSQTTAPGESAETVEAQCVDVPGFVVGTWTTVFDAQGQIKSRTTVELLDYQVASDSTMQTSTRDRGLFRGKRQRATNN
ncbi:MAG: hypothetical protein WD045_10415 [Pirellulaceae bacterium]